MNRFTAPLWVFLSLIVLLGVGLTLNPRELPSPLLGKPAPSFALPRLLAPQQNFSTAQMQGQVWLLNVWASWCAACVDEHALLLRLARAERAVPIVGLNYKDDPAQASAWLQTLGNPYAYIAVDRRGEVSLDYGVYGVPETYLIDQAGRVRVKQVGPLTAEIVEHSLRPWIQKLREEA